MRSIILFFSWKIVNIKKFDRDCYCIPHRAGVLRLVHVVPAVRLDVLRQPPALILAKLLHRLRLDQHPVN